MRLELAQWWRLPQQVRFLFAGGFNTIFGYLVFSALFLMLQAHIHYLIIGCIAHGVAVTSAFVLHRFLVFRSTDNWRRSFLRFNLSQLLTLGFGLAGLYGLVQLASMAPLVAQAIVTMVSVSLSYALHRHFSFRPSAREWPD